MALHLYNTLTRKADVFKPVSAGKVKMYVCGPTVNDVPHLGHARQQVTFDLLRKFLIFLGLKVTFVSNVTDIDDKIINKANELKADIKEFTEKNYKCHIEDYAKIGVQLPDVRPRATEYVPQMIDLVKLLEKKGFTYVIPSDGVYYDISKFKDYGKLSHQNVEDLRAGARVEANELKRNKEDFVLWKFSKPGEPSWDSPWGKGRPGWHIECSAMSQSILGLPIDIHGGGQDLIFPHHEDEIAQSEAAFEKKFSNFWVHNGMVNVDNVKMSKSLGNFRTIRDLLKNFSGEVIRYFIISSHYRKPVDFTEATLTDAKNSWSRMKNICSMLKDDGKENKVYVDKFVKAMEDDLNTPVALSVLWDLLRDEKAEGKYDTVKKLDAVFGLNLLAEESVPKEILALVADREAARKAKDFARSDAIRKEIAAKGWILEDSSGGQRVRKA